MPGARRAVRLSVALTLALASCSQTAPPADDAGGPDLPESVQRLERTRAAYPRDPEVLEALSTEYYRLARRSLDAGDQAQYRFYLGRDQAVLLAAIRSDPKDPIPHNSMGILRAYQGDLDSAHASFTNALRLLQRQARLFGRRESAANFYTNLAHIDV